MTSTRHKTQFWIGQASSEHVFDEGYSKPMDPNEQDHVHAFARTAQAFIDRMHVPRRMTAQELYHLLITLQSAALALPEAVHHDTNSPTPGPESTEKTRRAAVAVCLPESLGFYHSCHNPLQIYAPPEMSIGDAVDDLADIWRDLEQGLQVYTSDGAACAAACWRFSFQFHWRSHTLGLLSALGTLLDDAQLDG